MFILLLVLPSLVDVDAIGSPVVNIAGLGSVKGVFLQATSTSEIPTDVSGFFGIPYAKPPIGDLRWRKPETHEPWVSAPLDGSQYGSCCMQTWPSDLPGSKIPTVSEDCLFLNVYSPTAALNGKQKLPVMFWIHGGAYQMGCSTEYPGTGLVELSDLQAVMVNFNYRLNIFGFLGSIDLKARTEDGSFGNYGIQDQQMAMQWVADHIGDFGGNAAEVTIFGESAGGNSVIQHLVRPKSFPFYKRAIIQSGTYHASVTVAESESRYTTIRKQSMCQNISCLLGVPASKLYDPYEKTNLTWGPTVDGVSLSDVPWNLIHGGEYNNKVPIMIGSNRDEYAAFALLDPTISHETISAHMGEREFRELLESSGVGLENLEKVREIYDPSEYQYPSHLGNYSQWWWMAIRALTDMEPGLGACGVRNFSRNFARGGTPATFPYIFAHPTQQAPPHADAWPGTGPGSVTVGHGNEIPYVLRTIDDLAPGEEDNLSREMAMYWVSFATTGDPNSNGSPNWAKYDEDSDLVQRLQIPSEGGIVGQHGLRRRACDFWDEHPKEKGLKMLRSHRLVHSTNIIV